MTRMVTLGELIDEYGGFIQTGPFGSQLHQSDYTDFGVPVVMPKDIRDGRIDKSSVAHISESKAKELSRHLLKVDTIVLPRRGDVSKRAYIGEEQAGYLCGTGCAKIEPPTVVVAPKFLYYYLGHSASVQWLEGNAVGTTMLNLSSTIIGRLPFPMIPIELQQRIAAILSAYDDLIENNRRRIRLLEEAARLLYREWFVRLRFPGHEHVAVVGGVPEGWGRKKISDVCETVGGGTPSTNVAEYWDGEITWVVPTDVTRNDSLVLLDSERKITEKGLRESSARMVPAETILMTSRASVGFFALVDRPVCTNQGFINIIPHQNELRMYLLFNLMNRVEEIRGNAKGSTYPEISKGRFREMDVLIPPARLVDEFGRVATNIIDQVRSLKRMTLQLSKARDLLLPKLMNGELAA